MIAPTGTFRYAAADHHTVVRFYLVAVIRKNPERFHVRDLRGTGQICLRFRPGMDENSGVAAIELAASDSPPDCRILNLQISRS